MTTKQRATALAVRLHARDGTGLSASSALERLRASAAALEGARPAALAAPPEVGADGVMVLALTSPTEALPAVLTLADALRPLKTTFSLAVVADGTGRARAEAGGPAAGAVSVGRRTRAGAPDPLAELAEARARGFLKEADPRASRVVVTAREPRHAVAAILGLLLEAYDAMTPRQRQIVELARHSATQQEVARHLNVSRQAVNQSLTAAGWFHLRTAEEVVGRRLAALAGGGALAPAALFDRTPSPIDATPEGELS